MIALVLAAVLMLHVWSHEPAARTGDRIIPTPAFQFSSEYALSIQGLADRSDLNRKSAQSLLAEADTPLKKLRGAIVAGELEDGAAALSTLHEFRVTGPLETDRLLLIHLYQNGPDSLSAAEQASLVAHHGWFGKLALAYDQPAGAPERSSVLATARRTMLRMLIFFIAGGSGFLIGVGLLIFAIIMLATGKLRRHFAVSWPRTPAYLITFALYLLGFFSAELLIGYFVTHDSLLGAWLTAPLIVLIALYPLCRRQSWRNLRQALGWHRGQGVLREMGAGILGYLAGLPVLALGVVITLLLTRLTHAPSYEHPIFRYIGGGTGSIIGLYLVASVFAPIFEETMFRGALFSHLRQRWRFTISALLVALIFALLHPQGLAAVPVLMAIAVVLASIREWRGSIIGCMTAHALHNGLTMTMVLLLMR